MGAQSPGYELYSVSTPVAETKQSKKFGEMVWGLTLDFEVTHAK